MIKKKNKKIVKKIAATKQKVGTLVPRKTPSVSLNPIGSGSIYTPLDTTTLPNTRESNPNDDPEGWMKDVKEIADVPIRAVRRKKTSSNNNFLSGNWMYLIAMAVLLLLLIKTTKNGNNKK